MRLIAVHLPERILADIQRLVLLKHELWGRGAGQNGGVTKVIG
ncbi:MAG: hypothetical protein ACXAEB_12495 [Candidatus Thorarchaeota archaeon]